MMPNALPLRAMLRDTALQVALLSQQAEVPSMTIWRTRCTGLIEQLRQAMRNQHYDEAMIAEVSYAQCALLDEAALRHLPDHQRNDWESEPLQVRFFGSYNAGDVVYERIDALLRQSEPPAQLVELYSTLLGLGFLGRYPDADNQQRQRIVATLARLSKIDGQDDSQLLIVHARRGWRIPWRALSPLSWAVISIGLTIGFWVLLDRQLDQAVTRLTQPQAGDGLTSPHTTGPAKQDTKGS
ncbi:DotU/TssL family secretion system protein [Andreprevotia chitinilytica]|uniref:DotU/TssL family secretion system protein n=1 Tax=Andreprevotia chitinilytica TaxID=396808 RepID=UPI00068B5FBD|nr:DotU/TssL family secretion system protein [Andreprevotia chitinilytica]